MLHKDLVHIIVNHTLTLPHKAARYLKTTQQFHSPVLSLPPDFGRMLQQQQVLLMKLLNQQDEIQETQKLFEKGLKNEYQVSASLLAPVHHHLPVLKINPKEL